MSRTRRKVPHWVSRCEKRERFWKSIGDPMGTDDWNQKWMKLGSTRLKETRKQIETGNFDMSDHEHSEDIERRQQIRNRVEDRAAKEDL